MLNFNVGALHQAPDEVRAARITAANDLVRRTLAQHGLMPGFEGGESSEAQPVLPGIEGLMARFKAPLYESTVPDARLPGGAEFRRDVYSCAEGSRAYRTYVPSTAAEGITGLVVMLHGCTQNPEDFAAGTGMNTLAEEHRLVVVYPHQARGENAQSCWNWFRRGDQRRDRGEPAILAGMTRKVAAELGVPGDRTFVAGLSAGAAMAVILGETYPDVYSAVGAHSGLPYGAAKDVPSAFAAMAGRGDIPAGVSSDAPAVPTIVFHGTTDATVHPANGEGIARHVTGRGASQTIETEDRGQIGGRSYHRKVSASVEGVPQLEHWSVDGLGHAWSGGRAGGSYTDLKGPDASAEMVRFFFEAVAGEQ